MPRCRVMRFYQSFPTAIPLYEVGYPRVTHPSATKLIYSTSEQALPLRKLTPFDLHVLSTPPAFILSQDQTLMLKFVLCRINASLLSKLSLMSVITVFGFNIYRYMLTFNSSLSQVTHMFYHVMKF